MPIQSPSKSIKSFNQLFCTVFFVILFTVFIIKHLNAAEYFQQHISYEINVELIPELGRLEGNEKLIYVNNSPDTLTKLYFHLYFNKFRSGSYAFPFSKKTSGYIDIMSLKNVSGKDLTYEIDNTILKLHLGENRISPGDSLILFFEFVSVLPPSQSRFGYTGDHFDVGNWYPVPAVYDQYGWHADQHIDAEFYQEWANYKVDITVPKDFVVGATGVLLNPEVLPDSVTFKDRKINYYNLQELDTSRVTYKFCAERVHDFAWSADPELVLLEKKILGVELNFLLMPYRYDEWEKIIDNCVEGFKFLCESIGQYPYKQLTIVDSYITAGGIEYPNIVMINDLAIDDRQLAITVIHEMAHQWFYGLLGNNQTRYGWMDEGFATFYEISATEKIWGLKDNFYDKHNGFWTKIFGLEVNSRRYSYLNYFEYAFSGLEEPANTHYDQFQNDPYIPQYDKTGVILFTLQNMVGDSLFKKAIQNYFNEWKYRHPHPEGFFRSFERTTNMALDWFWDEWFNKTWKCDYRVEAVRNKWKNNFDSLYYSSYIHLQRIQPITMPLNLRVTLKNGQALNYRIPVEGWLRDDAQENDLKPWHISSRNYLASLKLPDKISKVELDPEHKIPDINVFNNDNKLLPPIKIEWFHRQYLHPYLDAYSLTLFPSMFYNTPDGFKIGFRSKGNYIFPFYQSSSEVLFSTKKFWPSAEASWKSPISMNLIDYKYTLNGHYIDGRVGGKVSVVKNSDNGFNWELGWEIQRLVEEEYLIAPWSRGNVSDIFLMLEKEKNYNNSIYSWNFTAEGRSSTFGSDFDFQQVELSWTHSFEFDYDKKLTIQMLSGFSFGNIPFQNLYYLGQASPIKQFDNPYIRARGTLPTNLIKDGHFMVPGGGDIRSGLDTPVDAKTIGENVLSGKLKLYIPNLFEISPARLPILSRLEWNIFTNWAQVWDSKIKEDQFVGETGFSISYDYIPIWLRYFHIAKIYIDFPIWLNKPANGYDNWDYRWTLRVDIQKIFN